MFRTKIYLLICVLFLPIVISPPQSISAQPEDYDPVVRIAWNNDGSLVAVGYHSGILEIRDGATGDLVFTDDSRFVLIDLDWSLHNQRLALLQFDGEFTEIVIYDITTQSTNTVYETTYAIRAIRWSPDGEKLAVTTGTLSSSYLSGDHGVNVWELAQGELELVTSYIRPVGTIAWGPDSTSLAITDMEQGNTRIFDVTTDEEIALLGDVGSFSIEYSPDGTMIASLGNDDELSIYDTESYQELHRFSVYHTSSRIAWGADKQYVVVSGRHNEDGNLVVYDIQTGQPTFSLVDDTITAIDWSPDGTKIAYGIDREFYIIDVPLTAQPPNDRQDNVTDIEWNPDGSIVAICYLNGILQLFDGVSGTLIETHIVANGIYDFSWSPDGNKLAMDQGATLYTNRVSIYDLSTGAVESSQEISGEYIGEAVWSSDGMFIAVTIAENLTDWGWSNLVQGRSTSFESVPKKRRGIEVTMDAPL